MHTHPHTHNDCRVPAIDCLIVIVNTIILGCFTLLYAVSAISNALDKYRKHSFDCFFASRKGFD